MILYNYRGRKMKNKQEIKKESKKERSRFDADPGFTFIKPKKPATKKSKKD